MKQTVVLAVLIGLTANLAWAADDPTPPATLLGRPGKVLLNDDLSQPPQKGVWRGPGDWTVVDGVLKGTELEKDHHPAVHRRALAFKNAIIRYEFQFAGAKASSLSINDAKEHVCRVQLGPHLFRVQKDDHDHAGPDKPVVFDTQRVAIEPGKWHTLVVEIVGPEMVATLDGKLTSFGSNELIATEKANFGFTVSGDHVLFRNLCIWEAELNPDWSTNKARLAKDHPKTHSP